MSLPLTELSVIFSRGTHFHQVVPRMNLKFDGVGIRLTMRLLFDHQDLDGRDPKDSLRYRLNFLAKFPRKKITRVAVDIRPSAFQTNHV